MLIIALVSLLPVYIVLYLYSSYLRREKRKISFQNMVVAFCLFAFPFSFGIDPFQLELALAGVVEFDLACTVVIIW